MPASKSDIGIKYCGGCRCGCDRRSIAEKITAALPDATVGVAEPGGRYDVLLVMCGCATCCANLDGYQRGTTIIVFEPEQAEEASEALRNSKKAVSK